jgi:hypothetical protein
MVCHYLNVGAKPKLAKELYLLITVKSTFTHNKLKFKNGINLATSIVNFKTNVLGTLDILPTPREMKRRS